MKYWIWFHLLFFALMGWPFIVLVNRVEPFVWDLPFFVFWCYAVGAVGAIGHALIGWFIWKDPDLSALPPPRDQQAEEAGR